MQKKYAHLWLEFKGSPGSPLRFYSGKLQHEQLETTKPARYFESLLMGSWLPHWRKSAMGLLQAALEVNNRQWTDIRSVYCYFEEFQLPDLQPQVYPTGDIFLGTVEFESHPKLRFSFEMDYKKIQSIRALEAAFEGTPLTPLDYCTPNSETLLHIAVEQDNLPFARELLEYGFSATQPTRNFRPIMLATSLEMAQLLHQHGADIHERPPGSNVTLVYYAAQSACLPLVEWYLAEGIEFTMTHQEGTDVFYPFSDPTAKHIPCIEYWLDRGMDIHYVYPYYNHTLLQAAQKSKDQTLIDFLISRDAER